MLSKYSCAFFMLMFTNVWATQLELSESEKGIPDKSKLQWGTPEPTTIYNSSKCLIRSAPGCQSMWLEEKKKEYDEKIQRKYDKKYGN